MPCFSPVSKRLFHLSIIVIFGLCLMMFSAILATAAPLPTATIDSLNGNVLIVYHNRAPQPAKYGNELKFGDMLVTQFGAEAELTLPDGSRMLLKEGTILECTGFDWDGLSGAKRSFITLYSGSVRVLLTHAHQSKGSFFKIKTPNTLVNLHFSQPDVEVNYEVESVKPLPAILTTEPEIAVVPSLSEEEDMPVMIEDLPDIITHQADPAQTGTTTVLAYTVDAVVLNLLSTEVKTIQRGQRAEIRGRGITATLVDGNPIPVATLVPTPQPTPVPEILVVPRQAATEVEPEEEVVQREEEDFFSPREFPKPTRRKPPGNRPRPHDVDITVDE